MRGAGASSNNDQSRKSRAVSDKIMFLDPRFAKSPLLVVAVCRIVQVGLSNAAWHKKNRGAQNPGQQSTGGGAEHASFITSARHILGQIPDATLSEAYQVRNIAFETSVDLATNINRLLRASLHFFSFC